MPLAGISYQKGPGIFFRSYCDTFHMALELERVLPHSMERTTSATSYFDNEEDEEVLSDGETSL